MERPPDIDSLRRDRGRGLRRRPSPGRELVDLLCRVSGEAGEHVGEPGLRIDAVELGGLDEGVDGGCPLATVVGAGEQPVLAAERDAAEARSAMLLSISKAAVVAIAGQRHPAVEGIAEGARKLALARDLAQARLEPALELEGSTPDPAGQGRTGKLDALAPMDLGLPIKRQVIGIFADQDMGEQPGTGPAALDGQIGWGGLMDRLARAAQTLGRTCSITLK